MLKAIRTPQPIQPEGGPEYADRTKSNPASAGFFFFAQHRAAKRDLDLRPVRAPKAYQLTSYEQGIISIEPWVSGERFELPTNGLQPRGGEPLVGGARGSSAQCV